MGSNIFNMLLIIGTSAVINPIDYNITYNMQILTLLIGTIIMAIFPFINPKDKISRIDGLIFVMLYVIYLIGLAIK